MVNSSSKARVNRDTNREIARTSPRNPARKSADPGVVRPWRQWHGASVPHNIAPLEVTSPTKPQWGRYIYLLIVLLILAAILRAAYESIFWFNTQGMISGRQHNVAPVQTVSVKEILVSPADYVESGQPLVALESPELVQALVRSEAEIARIQTEFLQSDVTTENSAEVLRGRINSLQAKMEILESQYNRERNQIATMEELVQAGAAQSGHLHTLETTAGKTLSEYREVQAELASSRQQLENLERSAQNQRDEMLMTAQLESLKSLRESVQDQLARLDLRAPVSGIVSRLPVSKGDVLTAGDPAVVVVDKSELRAYMYFPPSAQHRVSEGVVLQVKSSSGEKIPLRIVSVYPAIDRLPVELQSQHRPNESAVVVEAVPVNGRDFPDAMRSGTPVESRIPRWAFIERLENRFKRDDTEAEKSIDSTARANADS